MSYRVHRDDERTNFQILTGGYMDCREDERIIGCNRLGSMSHRHDKRSEYHVEIEPGDRLILLTTINN